MPLDSAPTARQRQVLWLLSRRPPPTIREIGKKMGITSTNGVHDHIRALERKGLVRMEPKKWRRTRLTKDGWSAIDEIDTGEFEEAKENLLDAAAVLVNVTRGMDLTPSALNAAVRTLEAANARWLDAQLAAFGEEA